MLKDAREISRAFDLIYEACYNVKDHNACEGCPLRNFCLDDSGVSVLDIGDTVSASLWDDFLNFADNVEFSKADLDAQYADFMRDLYRDERILNDEYSG